ncbi:B-type flagellin [Pirellulimonas nuda]|uniref:Flagellin n=1 Tax=Pirellulimonas nuda TaxID=2528009 RepID=A0A518DJS9_9BACT|nr:flagellin [Pirellulimonas nuda]QDU91730.1 B-type flagellin [Pirellulimonas nuda]
MTRINTNVGSLVGRNNLAKANATLSQSLTRLSTGLRINTGKDDPAGLIASENLRSDITSIRKAISNTDRANQVIATADSALGQVSSLLNDIRGLVTESANSGALSDAQLAANQLQVDSSLEALNRIAQTTTFQGRRLLDGSLDFITSTSDTDFSNVGSLQIDQANLGAAGSVPVSLNVTTAATKGQLNVANIPAGGTPAVSASGSIALTVQTAAATAATGSLDVTVQTAAATPATGNVDIALLANQGAGTFTLDTTNSASFTLTALAAGNAEGAEGVGAKNIVIVDGAGEGTLYDAGTDTLTVTVDITGGNNTVADLVGVINAGTEFAATATTDGGDAILASNTGTGTLAGGRDASTEQIAVTSASGDNLSFTIAEANGNGATPTVTGDATNGYTITIDDTVATTVDDIRAAIAGIGEVSAATYGGSASYIGSLDVAPGSAATLTGGAAATTSTESIAITSATGDNISITLAEANGNGATPTLTGDATNGYVVTVDDASATTLASIASFIQTNISEVSAATYSGSASFTGATDTPPSALTLTGGAAGTTGTETISLTSATGNNISITIAEGTGVGATPTLTGDATNGYTVTVDDSAATSLSAIASFIQSNIAEISAATYSGSASYTGATDTPPGSASTLTGGTPATSGGIAAAVVFELAGSNGSEVLSFGVGTSIAQLVTGINLVKDATGVEAVANGTTLELTSTTYGSSSVVDFKVISEGTGSTPSGVFSTAAAVSSRDTGTDIIANVNGIAAKGAGNSLSINTATLDLSSTITAGFTGQIDFNITGGGALFQLGPDVVSNQQARLGIGSVNTARLGGVSGKLFELGTGNGAALATDANGAAKIVEEAIDQVTGLRGRLGAFQRTTLETNRNALNDTLVNLQDAESAIRDADFAEESAALTRAQILVQSGTSVLSIANQNPQNVLALLR